jgi:hypothetical protein
MKSLRVTVSPSAVVSSKCGTGPWLRATLEREVVVEQLALQPLEAVLGG